MPIVALTAMHGLVDELRVTPGEALLITGASGDVGHLAVQLAKLLGARVLAVASGADGVRTVRELGADAAVDGRTGNIAAAAREFAPTGIDAILSLVGGTVQDAAIATLREGGRVAYPIGVVPEPEPRPGAELRRFDLTLDTQASTRLKTGKLNDLIASGPFSVRIAKQSPWSRRPRPSARSRSTASARSSSRRRPRPDRADGERPLPGDGGPETGEDGGGSRRVLAHPPVAEPVQ